MYEKKDEISKKILDSLTMEDLWKSHNLRKIIKNKYPRAYMSITEPYRDFGLYNFIKLAESQQKVMEEAINLGSIDSFPGKNVDFALKVIKKIISKLMINYLLVGFHSNLNYQNLLRSMHQKKHILSGGKL